MNMTPEERIEALNRTVQNLENRVFNLENQMRKFEGMLFPTIQMPKFDKLEIDDGADLMEDEMRCSKCGIKLENVMSYCCPHAYCPTGLGGTIL